MKRSLLLFIFSFGFYTSFAQITVEGPIPAQVLIQNNLIGNPNFPATNFGMMNGNQFSGPNSISTFNCTDANIVPFTDGVILSNGAANGIVGLPTTLISTGGQSWPGDTELSNLTGLTNLFNASSLQFDFVAEVPAISFDFMMASEEYDGNSECQWSDTFAFIIRNNTTGVSKNLAMVPGTTTPISVTSVNDNTNCPANTAYFAGYNSVGFGGQTVVFELTGNLTIGDSYTVKIVVADQNDAVWDSALFVRNSSFGAYPVVDQEPMDLVIEDTDMNGYEIFDLTVNEALMLGAINTAVYTFDFNYYLTQADAEAQVNPIANPQAYQNTTDLESIYVSMRNPYTGHSITTEFMITIDSDLLGVEEVDNGIAKLYPNPVTDVLHIDGLSNIQKVNIYAMNGQLLSSQNVQNSMSTTVDFSNHGSGLYLVNVVTDNGSTFRRVVK
ncbi:T9SS type A sorting domain-containing protein [Subsaxibacter sp. CAU 1640]|uniref:choice-of-anchor L domain-containing protein n=1 Tax=Subsaxibacter sp. CAU 1640 TaxID=2933271 RepID=UPI002004B157|nr:choice-of-anchor L domain-containing protein [Subsaxibacter sp. CAU 1640]MCK7591411.1 T9SS type A sorting domain-containing protein [Subsaxibacter sp. CAU 1640]